MSQLHLFIPYTTTEFLCISTCRFPQMEDTSLPTHVRTMHPERFDTLFEGRNEHFIWHMFRMFEAFKTNQFRAPWKGEWFTARQAHRLICILYGEVPNVMTILNTAVIQYVFDTWNIPSVFGENSVYTHFCGQHCRNTAPPTNGPRERLTAEDFARLLRI